MKFLYNIRSFFNNIAYWSDSYYKLLVFFFFAAYFFIGYFAYNDYGISWDEDISRKNGLVSVAYIIKKIKPELIADKPVILNMTDLHSWQDKDYGVVFEVPLVILENLFGLENNHSPKLYYLRHFCTFLFFFLGVLHLFLLLNYRFGNWRIGLLGCLLLILSPRIFADSFYNDKDIVLLSAFIITSYYLLQYLSNKSIQTAFWLGFFMAVTVNVRITGIVIPAITLGFIALDLYKHKANLKEVKKISASTVFLLLVFAAFTVIFWPYLWENPLENFLQAFHNMSKFRWNNYVLYQGDFIRATNLPWHYIPVWLGITTPFIYLLFFLIGFIYILVAIWKAKLNFYNNDDQRQDLVITALFFGPLLAVILMKSVLYDGWRQMFFLYGSFIYIIVKGIVELSKNIYKLYSTKFATWCISVLYVVLLFSFISTAFFMIKYHPYQNVYFNFLVGNNIENRFERDYWGLSYRQALEYIIEVDKRDTILVSANLRIGKININMLPEEAQEKIKYSDNMYTSDYFLTEHRFLEGHRWYPDKNKFEEVHSIIVDGIKIMSVYKALPINTTENYISTGYNVK